MTLETTWTEVNDTRAMFYRLLSGVFARELSVADIESYREGDGRGLLQDLAESPDMAASAETILAVFSVDTDVADLRIDLATRFASLFLGAGGRRTAPPYESHYTDEKGLLFQAATREMDGLLATHDVHTDADFKEPADHIVVQLELMAVLSARAAEVAPDSPEARALLAAQADFLDSHLLNWVPAFAKDCATLDGSGFYGGMAGVLMAFLETDRAQCATWLAET